MSDIYFYSTQDFSYTQLLESHVETIKEELTNLMNSDYNAWTSAYPNYLSNDAIWKTFEFVFFGINHLENQKLCPKTSEIIKQIPELITAQFSILHPKSHILPHKGFSKLVLRNHLPLIVPEGNQCAIKIENETHHWKEGKLVTFDDSFIHEAWNKSDEIRVVLMFDIAKPNCGYTANEICTYKLQNIEDENLLKIAPQETWNKWLAQGFFSFL